MVYYLSDRLRLSDDADLPELEYHALGAGLAVDVAVDRPFSMMLVTRQQREEWEVDLNTLHQVALENLHALPHCGFETHAPGVWLSACGDGYDTARMLDPARIASLGIEGPPVFVPAAQNALVIADPSSEGIDTLPALIENLMTLPRWYSAAAVQVDPSGQYTPWSAAPSAPAWIDLHLATRGAWYSQQKDALERSAEAREDAAFVATFAAMTRSDDGVSESYAVVAPVPTLLPRTDLVAVMLGPDEDADVALVPWADFVDAVGPALQPEPAMYPERWRIRDVLPAETLARLRALGEVIGDP